VPFEAAPFDVEAPLEGDALKVVSLPGRRWRRETAQTGEDLQAIGLSLYQPQLSLCEPLHRQTQRDWKGRREREKGLEPEVSCR